MRNTNWTKWLVEYSSEDDQAFRDGARIDSHFGLPMNHVHSLSLRPDGCSNVHAAGKQFRTHYFGNMVAYRHIKSLSTVAWIWDERYRFEGQPVAEEMRWAQQRFLERLGKRRMAQIASLARTAGLNPGGKTNGRPDLAVYFPAQEPEWRFIEIKCADRGDKLGEQQKEWLKLFATYLGPESAVELELRCEPSK